MAIKHSWPSAVLLYIFNISPLKTHEATFPFSLSLIHFQLQLRSVCRRFQSSSGWQEEAAAVLDKANGDKAANNVRERQREPQLPELGKGLELQRERAAPGTGSRAGCGVGLGPGLGPSLPLWEQPVEQRLRGR